MKIFTYLRNGCQSPCVVSLVPLSVLVWVPGLYLHLCVLLSLCQSTVWVKRPKTSFVDVCLRSIRISDKVPSQINRSRRRDSVKIKVPYFVTLQYFPNGSEGITKGETKERTVEDCTCLSLEGSCWFSVLIQGICVENTELTRGR